MKRTLSSLRIELTPAPGRRGLSEFIANDAPCGDPAVHPPAGKKWCDVVAGDVCRDREGHDRTVLRVRIFRAYGGKDGDVIASGRQWLRDGTTLTPG